jgi:hypothetical protein
MVACADGGVTAPARPAAHTVAQLAPSRSAADTAAEFTRDSIRHAAAALKDSVEAARDSVKAAAKVERNLAKAQLDSLRKDWEAYRRSVKRTGEKSEVLRCEPQARQQETRTVGRKGGTINVGPHRLVIPAGALLADVQITGTAPTSSAVNVEFAPHGLQFVKPVEMTIDYRQCIVPDSTELGVTYVLNGWWGVEKMPASDARKDRKITALTDHFSGYIITIGRSRTY